MYTIKLCIFYRQLIFQAVLFYIKLILTFILGYGIISKILGNGIESYKN